MYSQYIVILSPKYNREHIVKYLEGRNDVDRWFYNLPNSFFIITTLDASQICEVIESRFGEQMLFVTKINSSGEYFGRLPTDHWNEFIV